MSIHVDLDLIRKYNKAGPRYTSYPTAPHFSNSVGETEQRRHIEENNAESSRDISLYFHIPFCDTLCWFCGCTTVITRKRTQIELYLKYLQKEIEIVSSRLHPQRKVTQMHFGGGTPTYLSPDQILWLGKLLHAHFTFAEDAEISCEMDPRGLTEQHIAALKTVGFNRLSMGIQDFNPTVQEAVNRVHSYDQIATIVQWIRKHQFYSLNFDLIYGLPFQTTQTFATTLDQIMSLSPDRLAVFSYAHLPWLKPHMKLIKQQTLPSPEHKLEILKLIIERLSTSGFTYIGMDHFARPTDELTIAQKQKTLQRNFQGYSTKGGTDIYALGMSAISSLPRLYSQNFKDLPQYYQALDQGSLPIERGYQLSDDDVVRRTTIMRLMCDMSIDYEDISQRIGHEFTEYFSQEIQNLQQFVDDGMLRFTPGGIVITDRGRLLIRNIAMEFDVYLQNALPRFSKTI